MLKRTSILPVLLFAIAGCQGSSNDLRKRAADLPSQAGIAASAEEVRPLKVGEPAATGILRKPLGESVSVASLYAAKPTVLIFYRGAWCPYCTEHLKGLIEAEAKLIAMGFQVLAVSPDKPSILRAASKEHGYAYQLLSDSDMSLAKSFGLAFKVDDETLMKYKGYGIDLERNSGMDHHLLPVPAVYVIDQDGVIQFAHWDPNYQKRLSMNELLAAAERAAKK
ncbi:MAG: peroxiredoxin-like family protein [Phycisphaeraceae bacterium]